MDVSLFLELEEELALFVKITLRDLDMRQFLSLSRIFIFGDELLALILASFLLFDFSFPRLYSRELSAAV